MKRKVTRKSAISFYSHELTNNNKINILRNKAEIIRASKNSLSQTISTDPLKYAYLTKIDIVNLHGKQIPLGLSSNEWQRAIFDMCIAYENKFEQIRSNITFNISSIQSNNKSYKKSNVRSTSLTKVLSYLARNNIESKEQIQSKIESLPPTISGYDNIHQFYKLCLDKIDKFGQRLFRLVQNRLTRFLKNITPIKFESLTYSNMNQFNGGLIIKRPTKSSNKLDDYNAYFMIAVINSGSPNNKLAIPIKYSKKYHGQLKYLTKKNRL